MRHLTIPSVLILAVVATGCGSRSISNSGYHSNYHHARGEIHDLHLLAEPSERIRDREIPVFAASAGDRVLVLQSGAAAPDEAYLSALSQAFDTIPISGLSLGPASPNPTVEQSISYNTLLRNAATAADAKYIIVTWGVLDTRYRTHGTAAVSWIPIVGGFIPDNTQSMRIRLKAIIMEPQTGCWRMVTTSPESDVRSTAPITRADIDQDQVAKLKQLGYDSLTRSIANVLGVDMPTSATASLD